VIQAVIAFPSADEAKRLLAAQKSQWTSCAGRTLTMTQEMKARRGIGCQRALAVRNNVAIDISACRYDVTNQAVDILNAIAVKIPH
jgi:PknH-like extracellular domain